MEFEIGPWNVRTINKPGAQINLLYELIKWLGNQNRNAKTYTIRNSLYSRQEIRKYYSELSTIK